MNRNHEFLVVLVVLAALCFAAGYACGTGHMASYAIGACTEGRR